MIAMLWSVLLTGLLVLGVLATVAAVIAIVFYIGCAVIIAIEEWRSWKGEDYPW